MIAGSGGRNDGAMSTSAHWHARNAQRPSNDARTQMDITPSLDHCRCDRKYSCQLCAAAKDKRGSGGGGQSQPSLAWRMGRIEQRGGYTAGHDSAFTVLPPTYACRDGRTAPMNVVACAVSFARYVWCSSAKACRGTAAMPDVNTPDGASGDSDDCNATHTHTHTHTGQCVHSQTWASTPTDSLHRTLQPLSPTP